jgi:hypothetical protein
MRIAVVPNDVTLPSGWHNTRISLFDHPTTIMQGSVGSGVPRDFLLQMGRTVSNIGWDIAALSLAVIAADRYMNRSRTSADGWTRQIELAVSVSDVSLWDTLKNKLQEILGFLTGDFWYLTFLDGGIHPGNPKKLRAPSTASSVSLLSGGLDSLIGAIDLTASGETPLFVSNIVRGDCEKQYIFVKSLGAATDRFLQLNHNARTHNEHGPEISQRPRSLAFIAFGILAAMATKTYVDGGRVNLYIPENGFISLNIPLTPLRGGSLSTRTTHPLFIAGIQTILKELGVRVDLKNPYQFKTKGEMMQECADQIRLDKLAHQSMSCGRSGRSYLHCGRCLPCLVRRGAFYRWKGDITKDKTPYKHPRTSSGFIGSDFMHYDDVLQTRSGLNQLHIGGRQRWIGSAVNAIDYQDPEAYRSVAVRGLEEVGAFLQIAGLS